MDNEPVFNLLSDTIVKHSVRYVIGCENNTVRDLAESFKAVRNSDGENDAQILFEKNMFRTPPQACIDVTEAGELEIYAEVSNDLIMVPESKDKTKTALGKIKSNILKIRVEN